MNINFRLILIKLVASVVIFTIAFDLFFDAGVAEILTFAVLVTVISYFVGDQIILPRLGNRSAALIDFFTVYAIVWIFGNVLLHSYEQLAWGSITAAFLTGVSELLLHQFVPAESPQKEKQVFKAKPQLAPKLSFGTEFAEEQDPRKKK